MLVTELSHIKTSLDALTKGTVHISLQWYNEVTYGCTGSYIINILNYLTISYIHCSRFILSLSSCKQCMVIDDRLNVLPISSQTLKITPLAPTTKVQY